MMQYLIEVLVRVGQSGLCSGFDGWHPYKLDESHRVWTLVKWNPTRPAVLDPRSQHRALVLVLDPRLGRDGRTDHIVR